MTQKELFIGRLKSRSCVFFITTILFLFVYLRHGFTTTGFDDETWTIYLVEGFKFNELVQWAQTNDVHPPLAYIYNYGLFQIFHDWSFVRLTTSFLLVSSLAFLSYKIARSYSFAIGYVFLVISLSSPATLMWGCSLRWYSLYTIIINLFFTICLHFSSKSISKIKFFITSTCFLLTLGYVNYVTLFLAPILLSASYFLCYKSLFFRDLKLYVYSIASFYLIYSHQIFVFLFNHYPNKTGQVFGFTKSIFAIAASQFSNIGLIPLTTLSLISIITISFILLISAISVLKFPGQNLSRFYIILLITCELFFLITGVSGKYRNLFILQPILYLFVCTALFECTLFSRGLQRILLCFLVIANIAGFNNVLKNENTIYYSWNIPVTDAVSNVKNLSKESGCEHTIVSSTDSIVDLASRNKGFLTIFPFPTYDRVIFNDTQINTGQTSLKGRYEDSLLNTEDISKSSLCFANIETYRGYADPNEIVNYNQLASSVVGGSYEVSISKNINGYSSLIPLIFPGHAPYAYKLNFSSKIDDVISLHALSNYPISFVGSPSSGLNLNHDIIRDHILKLAFAAIYLIVLIVLFVSRLLRVLKLDKFKTLHL